MIETGSVTPVGRLAEGGGGAARATPRQQAAIEQATGWLAGRLDCSITEAVGHLAKLARDTETTVAEAAVLLLGDGTAPTLPRAAPVPAQQSGPAGDTARTEDTASTGSTGSTASATEPALPSSVVDVLPVPAMLLAPVTREDGEIVDFVIERLNDNAGNALRDARSGMITGERVLRLFPHVRESGLFAALAQSLRHGEPLRLDLFPFRWLTDSEDYPSTVDIRGQRAEGRLLVTWRGHDVTSDRARRLEVTQQLGGLGWAEWNLITNVHTWSHELYAMHDRPISDGPLSFEDYLAIVHPDDAPVVAEVFRGLTGHADTAQTEYRVVSATGTRYFKLAATAVYDPGGAPLILRAVVQDVTTSRRAELDLAAARGKIERERREATLRMQRAVLPAPRQEFRIGPYDIAVRYQPAQSGNRVGGDWYDARVERSGDVVIAIGDVAGHELTAAAGMARIGNALRGLTATGQPANVLLGWLNELVCAEEDPEQVASVAIGSLGAARPSLRWAQAGHPPPVLVRDGEPRLLARPSGLLLGTLADAEYELATEQLAAGDVLIFYTDGLIERRDRDIDEGLVALLEAATGCGDSAAARAVAELTARLDTGTEDDVCLLVVRVLGV